MSTEDNNVESAPPEEAASNRNFLIILAVLGATGLLALLLIIGFAFVFRPAQIAARSTERAVIEATNNAVIATNEAIKVEGTQIAQNQQATSDAAATEAARPTNTNTPLPTAIPTETPIPPTDTVAPPTDTPAAQTPESGGGGGATVTPGGPTLTPTRIGGGSGGPNTATTTALVGGLTRTPTKVAAGAGATPTALPNTGFAEEAGLPGLLALGLGLIAVVFIIRQLRMRLR